MTIRLKIPVDHNPKHPDDVEWYQIDWGTLYLTDRSDTISTSAWSVPAGITVDNDTNTTLVANVLISGGTDDTDYELENTITTAGGRTKVGIIDLKVRDDPNNV